MSLFERYKKNLVETHCPKIAELAQLIVVGDDKLIEVIIRLRDEGKLYGSYPDHQEGEMWDGEDDFDAWQCDVATEDIPTICAEFPGS